MLLAACSSGSPAPEPNRTPSERPTGSPSPTGPVPAGDWPTYHADPQRTGVDPSSVAARFLREAWTSPTLDGAIYAEPLVFGDRVFVATENDSVYALAVDTGKVVWRTNVGTPIPRSELSCGNIDPTGITGTPVIDPDTGTLYAVAFVQPAHHEFVAIDTETGDIRWRRSADALGADPRVHQQRGALAIAGGRVYAPYGGLFGDCGDYHGRVVGRALDGTGDLIGYQVRAPRAGSWAPSGVAVDPFGDLLFATGNGDSTSFGPEGGDSVIRLSPDLKELAFWAPANWRDLDRGDVDLGSIGPAILDNGQVFQAGKDGVGRLLWQDPLGGIGGELFSKDVCSGGAWGGTAYDGSRVYVPCGEGLAALRITGRSFAIDWKAEGFDAGPPIVAGGAVWTVDLNAGRLLAFDAATGKQLFSHDIGAVEHFTTPSASRGQVFVAAEHRVLAFSMG